MHQKFENIFKPFLSSLHDALNGKELVAWSSYFHNSRKTSELEDEVVLINDIQSLANEGIKVLGIVTLGRVSESPRYTLYIISPDMQSAPVLHPVAIAPGVNAYFGAADFLGITSNDIELAHNSRCKNYEAKNVRVSFGIDPKGIRASVQHCEYLKM